MQIDKLIRSLEISFYMGALVIRYFGPLVVSDKKTLKIDELVFIGIIMLLGIAELIVDVQLKKGFGSYICDCVFIVILTIYTVINIIIIKIS